MATNYQEQVKMKYFYEYFENCWDYAHLCLERGLLLHLYIDKYRPSYRYMFKLPKPAKFSDIPADLQAGYKQYILMYYCDAAGIEDICDINDNIFTDAVAADLLWDEQAPLIPDELRY